MTLRRRYFLLTALRWLPTGVIVAVLVLFQLDRGLTLAEIGLVSATQAAVVLLLELPTGGLADALGRRPVLLAAGVIAVASTTLMLLSDSLVMFVLAWGLQGIYRALDSGPLEAWYVDAALAADPAHDLEADLSRAGFWLYAAIAIGSLASGVVGLLPGLPVDPLTAAVALAVVLEVLHLIGLAVLLREDRPPLGWRAAVAAARATPAVIRDAVTVGWRHPGLRLVLAVELSWGAGLTAVELLWQPRTADVLGSSSATWVFGLMSATAWVAGAGGALLVPPLVRLLRGRTALAAALLRVGQGLTVVGLALAGGLVGLVTAYVVFYVVHGGSNPLHAAMLHRRVGSEHRSTVLSLNSLVARVSGLPAGIGTGLLANAAGAPVALAVAAGVLMTAAPLYLLAARSPALVPAR